MNDYETEINKRTAKWMGLLILSALLFLVILMLVTSGCVTGAKNAYTSIIETPTPEPTPEPTSEPAEEIIEIPIVTVTEDPETYMLRTNGFHMREWHQWFRNNVQGINGEGKKDLRTLVTVYAYVHGFIPLVVNIMGSEFVVKPDDSKDQFLFVFVNMYSDDIIADDVRQYGMDCTHFTAQIDERLYFADQFEYPERRITEFDNLYTFDHVETPGPYGYQIVQEAGAGLSSAQSKEWLMGAESNAWDGYCQYSNTATR